MCGIIGVISKENSEELGALIQHGLYQLQNRGDYSAGIAVIKKLPVSRQEYRRLRRIAAEHTVSDFDPLTIEKGHGKVSEVFNENRLKRLVGFMGVGQVRYPTAGYTVKPEHNNLPPEEKNLMKMANIQPIHTSFGRIAIVHNGDIHNYHDIMSDFLSIKIRIASSNDLEAILLIFSKEFFDIAENVPDFERLTLTVRKVFELAKGTYSALAVVNNVGLVAFRDPEGRRPLFFGVKKDQNGEITDYAFASETVALEKMLFKGTLEQKYATGRNAFDEVKPGELVFIRKDFNFHRRQVIAPNLKTCPFEGSYFARTSSFINNTRVKRIRQNIIEAMWKRFITTPNYDKIKGDEDNTIICPVPRTAESAATHLSNLTGINFNNAIEKHPFSPRIFLQPTQQHRLIDTIADHYIFEEEVKGKKIILIDDSIVRGTTLRHIIKYLKAFNVKELHVFITFPEIRHPCMHAIDFHTAEELIADDKNLDQIKTELGLDHNDSLFYALPEEIKIANNFLNINMCDECYKKA